MIGVGLNLSIARDEFPPELRETAISLFGQRRGPADRRSISAESGDCRGRPPQPKRSVASSTAGSRPTPSAVLADAWRASATRCAGARSPGRSGSGVADGVDDRGNLLVVTAGGDRVALGAGEVHLRL